MQNRRNFYRILHVQPDAPMEIIRMSYLTLMRRLKMHPDLGGDHANAALINEAFSTLVDPARRALYDRELTRQVPYAPRRSSRTAPGETTPPAGLFVCAFCGTPHAAREKVDPVAECSFCQSPLCNAAGQTGDQTRRSIDRIPRELPVQFFLAWPQDQPFRGMTEDLSLQGLRLVSDLDMVPNERLKIDCAFCDAVGVVRHSNTHVVNHQTLWRVGIEFLTLRVKPTRGVFVSRQA